MDQNSFSVLLRRRNSSPFAGGVISGVVARSAALATIADSIRAIATASFFLGRLSKTLADFGQLVKSGSGDSTKGKSRIAKRLRLSLDRAFDLRAIPRHFECNRDVRQRRGQLAFGVAVAAHFVQRDRVIVVISLLAM